MGRIKLYGKSKKRIQIEITNEKPEISGFFL